MLSYAVTFLIIAIVAGVLGFGVIAGTAAMIAKVFFVIFLILFLYTTTQVRAGGELQARGMKVASERR